MHGFDLRQLECFVAVAEELHFRRAAERLGIAQSALSERISALEQTIGASLLFRTTRQVSLTQAGANFFVDALRILSDVNTSLAKAQNSAGMALTNIRVGGVDEAISMHLPAILLEFQKICSDVHVQVLEIASSDHHTQELVQHRTDVAFVRAPADDEFISSELLYRQPIVVAMSSENPLAQKAILHPKDLLNASIVGYPKHARPLLHDMLWSGFRKIGAQPKIVCEVFDKSTLLQFVAHGLGIALAPAWVKHIAPSGVSFVPFEGDGRLISLYVAYRASGNSPVIEHFLESVRSQFRNVCS